MTLRPRVLVVDDDPANRHLLEQMLGNEYEILLAGDGEQALEMCLREAPDLLLLDIEMPGLDGLQTCRRLKANPATASIPVIFVTSHDSPASEAAGLAAGAIDFIRKPIRYEAVRARVARHLQLKAQADRLRAMAYEDALTGVLNRRYFDQLLHFEGRVARRTCQPLSLVLIDIDRFKSCNDLHGHTYGDHCLRAVAAALSAALRRPQDLLARYGGEEFACLLPGTARDEALRTAEYLRREVEAAAIAHPHTPAQVLTVSLGVATLVPGERDTIEALVEKADWRLYEAKSLGRNRVCG